VPGWKKRYFEHKFPGVDDEGQVGVAAAYVEGLCWVMRYYYDGCASWTWFYPYHYAPFAADIADAMDAEAPPEFEQGSPFLSFQQLMGVLPPRSSHALPKCLAELMTDSCSEIADFYPSDFAIDLNGKKFAWQAVILLPFIDEVRLLEAMADCEAELTADEKRRNGHGSPALFVGEGNPLFKPMAACYGDEPCELLTLTPELFPDAASALSIAGTLTPL